MSIVSTGLSAEERKGSAAKQLSPGGAPFLEPLVITVAQAKQITNLGHSTIYALIKSKKLTVRKVGNRTLITYASVKALLQL